MEWYEQVRRLNRPWRIYGGDDEFLRVQIFEYEHPAYTPGTLQGFDWRAIWRPHLNSDETVELEIITDGLEGQENCPFIILHATHEQTAVGSGLIDRDGVFDVQGTRDGKTYTIITGETTYRKDVTR